MSERDIIIDILLWSGVAIELLCCIGILVMRTTYARLHYLGPASTVGIALIAAAIMISTPTQQSGAKAILVAVLLLIVGPVLSHATARAVKVRADDHLDRERGRP